MINASTHRQVPDPRKMQINLMGFLTNKTAEFMTALWKHLLDAQATQGGIPQAFIDEKKKEMREARDKDTRALNERDRRATLNEVREREKEERGGGGRGRGRGGRGGRGSRFDDRAPRGRDGGWGGRGGGGAVSLPTYSECHSPLNFSFRSAVV